MTHYGSPDLPLAMNSFLILYATTSLAEGAPFRSLKQLARGRMLYSPEALAKMLNGTAGTDITSQKISQQQGNVSIWLFDKTSQDFLEVNATGRFANFTIEQIARCAAAIPILYGSVF